MSASYDTQKNSPSYGRRNNHPLLSSLLLGISFSFNTTASPLTEEASYWRLDGHDAVFSAAVCETRGLCATVHYLNPQDKMTRDLFRKLADRADPRPHRGAPRHIDDADIHSLCGYQPEVVTKEKEDGLWHGTFVALISGRHYTINVKELSHSNVELRLSIPYLPFLSKTVLAERVENPPPACIPTRAMHDVLKLR